MNDIEFVEEQRKLNVNHPPSRKRSGVTKQLILPVICLLALLIISWHWYLAATLEKHLESKSDSPISVNPITDIVTVRIPEDSSKSADNTSLNALFDTVGNFALAPEWQLYARENFDIYAMILPYQIKTILPPAPPVINLLG